MRVFGSDRYRLLGYLPVSMGADSRMMWVLEALPIPGRPFAQQTIAVMECKYMDGDILYFLEKDGSVQNRKRETVELISVKD